MDSEKGVAMVEEEDDDDGKDLPKHVDDADANAETRAKTTTSPSRVFQAPASVRALSAEERLVVETRLRWKIDLRLMPMIVLMYIMNYLDRNNIAAAKLAGILEDLGLSAVQFQVSVMGGDALF